MSSASRERFAEVVRAGGAAGDPADVRLLASVGLGFLFLLAGYEIKLEWFAARSGRIAIAGLAGGLLITAAVPRSNPM